MKKIKQMWLPLLIIIQVLNVMIDSYLINKKILNLYRLSRIYIGLLIVNFIVIIIYAIKNYKKKKKVFNRITDLYLVFIIIFSLIASILAIKPEVSFFGFRGRYEGFFQIMYYFSLFVLSSFVEKKYKIYIIYTILLCGLIEAIYAMLQVTQLLPVVTKYRHGKPWATGFITNPNFFGTFMLLCLLYSIGLLFDLKKKLFKYMSIVLIIIFFIGLLLSNTLSVVVGLFIAFLYLLVYAIINKKYKELIILVIITFMSFGFISLFDHSTILHDINKSKNQVAEMSKGNVEDTYGTNRIFVWKRTIWVLPDHIWHGVGIDNFYYAFNGKVLYLKGRIFDKAHNEYLQILICEGIFALISYLLLFGTVTIRGIISSFKNKELFLILPIIGYLVQAFFNISVIEVAPFFYIALGLCIDREETYPSLFKKVIKRWKK